ncbi:MAG: hypothetical protein GY839_19490 [candidate division Zixibacteria bacterium]|nr:hypothetical protein [candidate division Zixibacteria bacterium]
MNEVILKELRTLPTSKLPAIFELSSNVSAVCWEYHRLKFYRDPIEQLANPNDIIAVKIIPSEGSSKYYRPGFYIMTKEEFYNKFFKVTETHSFRIDGIYHYPKPPQKVDIFFYPD